jgi:hypothetical protein
MNPNRLKLRLDERDSDLSEKEQAQQAFRYYNALHQLSISEGKQDIYLMLVDNKAKFEQQLAECESDKVVGWLQGAIQIIDSFLENIDIAGDKLHEIRARL